MEDFFIDLFRSSLDGIPHPHGGASDLVESGGTCRSGLFVAQNDQQTLLQVNVFDCVRRFCMVSDHLVFS